MIARYLLGLMFITFGLNGFVHFIPLPPPASPIARAFLMSLGASHYIMAVSALQLVCGLLLLLGRFVPLALTILAAIIANILLYHVTMDPKSLGGGTLAAILWILTFTAYRSHFRDIFSSGSEPASR